MAPRPEVGTPMSSSLTLPIALHPPPKF